MIPAHTFAMYPSCNVLQNLLLHGRNAGIPDPPHELYHDVSANTESSAVIQWQPPLYTGGRLIRYTVTANGQTESVSGDEFTYNITGLDVNTDYTVEVTAVNSCGLESEPATITVNIEARGEKHHTILDKAWDYYGALKFYHLISKFWFPFSISY